MKKPLNKKILAAIKSYQGSQGLWWTYENSDLYVRTVSGGYTLREVTGLRENGTVISRKIFQTQDFERAQEVNAELKNYGIDLHLNRKVDMPERDMVWF